MNCDTRALTGIRGVAALWVVAHHLAGGYGLAASNHFLREGYLAVDLFFVLSGFVLALNHGEDLAANRTSSSTFYLWRLGRIYPLYFVLISMTEAVLLGVGGTAPPPIAILLNLTLTQSWFGPFEVLGPSWSLSVEVVAYLAFPWIAAWAFRSRPTALALALVACWGGLAFIALSGAATATQVAFGGLLDCYTGGYAILRGTCSFVAGVCAYCLLLCPAMRAALSTRRLPEALVVTENKDLVRMLGVPLPPPLFRAVEPALRAPDRDQLS